jgi:hypothetical protein
LTLSRDLAEEEKMFAQQQLEALTNQLAEVQQELESERKNAAFQNLDATEQIKELKAENERLQVERSLFEDEKSCLSTQVESLKKRLNEFSVQNMDARAEIDRLQATKSKLEARR